MNKITLPDPKKFSGGELHMVFEEVHKTPGIFLGILKDSDDIMHMLLKADMERRKGIYRKAFIPYVPYARADRIMPGGGGDALGIKVMADLINYCDFDKIYVLDPHSDVTPALINRCEVIKPYKLIQEAIGCKKGLTFISPDAGAEKRTYDYCKRFGAEMVRATKKRNVETGEVESIDIIDKIDKESFVFVIDDICDGGKTFIELAKKLPKNTKPELIVTHGIFSKGITTLFEHYREIWTTNSFFDADNKIHVVKCEDILEEHLTKH